MFFVVDIDECSNELFGRYQALRVYAAIARLPKAEFSTGELAVLTGVPSAQCSKELGRLVRLSLLASASRRGDYVRRDESPFWEFVDRLMQEWDASMQAGRKTEVVSSTTSLPS